MIEPSELTSENLDRWLKLNPRWRVVELTAAEQRFCEQTAAARHKGGKDRGWISKTQDQTLVWDQAGVVGEYASCLYLGLNPKQIKGFAPLEQIRSGDLMGSIEIKTSRFQSARRLNLVCNHDQVKRVRPYLSVLLGCYPPKAIIEGYCWGYELPDKGRRSINQGAKHGIFVVSRESLRAPEELRSLMWGSKCA